MVGVLRPVNRYGYIRAVREREREGGGERERERERERAVATPHTASLRTGGCGSTTARRGNK